MGLFTYSPNIPNRPDAPKADQPLMQQNSQSINGLIAIDHVGFNINAIGGLHNQVTFSKNQMNPGIQTGVSAIYSNNPYSDGKPYPFFAQGAGLATFPLAGPTIKATNGYMYLPQGMIIQWGTKTNAGASGSVTFNLDPFPTATYMIQLTAYTVSSGSSNRPCSVISYSTSGFNYEINSGNSGDSLFWFAIGN